MRRFQFTIRGMLLTTAVIAFACSVGCLRTAKLEDGLFAFAAAWIVVGLVTQAADLWAAFRRRSGLTTDQRCGWWFAILSRAGLAMLFIGHFILLELLATNRLTLAETNDAGGFLGPSGHRALRDAILALSLLLVFAGRNGGRTPPPRRRWRTAISFLTTVAIVVVVYYLLIDHFLTSSLVHIALAGLTQGMPHAHAAYVQVYSDARAIAFLRWALLAGAVLLLDVIFLRLLIACWQGGMVRRAAAIAALCLSLVLTAIHPVWLATRGLKNMSPFFVEVYQFGPINRWVFGAVLAMVFVTAAARRMVPARQTPFDPKENWRRRPLAYYHEYRLLAIFVAATIVCMEVRRLMPLATGAAIPFWSPPLGVRVQEVVYAVLAEPQSELWLAVLCVAVYRALFGFARTSKPLGAPPCELPVALYAIVWTALLATVLMAAPIFAALGFGLALNWWRLPY